jgi:hypothetical protein
MLRHSECGVPDALKDMVFPGISQAEATLDNSKDR